MCVFIHVHICKHIYACKDYIRKDAHVLSCNIYIYMYTCTYIHMNVYACPHVYMYMCLHMYIYTKI